MKRIKRNFKKKNLLKKEYKVFVAFEEGKSLEEVMTLVKEDQERVKSFTKQLVKK